MEIQTKVGGLGAIGQQIRDMLKLYGLLRAYRRGEVTIKLLGWNRQGALYGVQRSEPVEAV